MSNGVFHSSEPVRIALLGASRIGRRVVPRVDKSPLLQLQGVASRDPEKARAYARELGLPKAYLSYADCLSDPAVEAVYIAVLNRDHADLIERALQAGKHVLCEKPLVLTAEEARRLYALAESNGRLLLEGFMYRFFPQMKRAVDAIRSGATGPVTSIRVSYSWNLYDLTEGARRDRATKAAGGGALHDLGSYGIDFINWITGGKRPVEVTGYRHETSDGFDLSTTAVLLYEGGLTASLDCAVNRAGANTFEVSGAGGSVLAPRFDWKLGDPLPVYRIDEDGFPRLEAAPAEDAFLPEFEHFCRAVRGQVTPHIPAGESIANAELLQLIRESVKAGRG